MKTPILVLALAAQSFAGEFAVLATGFRLHVDHHELGGASVKLYQKDGGFTQLDASLVTAYGKEVEATAATAPGLAPAGAKTAVATKAPRELGGAAARKNGP